MAFTRGRCTNFDYCSVAESRRDIEVRVGEDFVCPECGKPLKAPQMTGRATSPVVPALIGLGALFLLGGAVVLGMRMGSGAPGVPPLAPVAAPPVAAPPVAAPMAEPAPAPLAAPAVHAAAVPVSPPAVAPVENVLARVHGGAAMGANVMAPLAAAYLAETGDSAVSTSADAGQTKVSGLRGGQREAILIVGDAVSEGFAALGSGRADIVVAPRRITTAEQSSLAGLGNMTLPAAEHVLALDAQAVIVNASNQLTSMSRAQIRDLFAGAFTDWAPLGGPPGPVDIYAIRPQGLRQPGQAAGGEIAPEAAPGARWVADGAAVSRAVVADTRGVGLVDLTAIGGAKAVAIAETGAAPASPTDHAAVANGDYPLATKLYLYDAPQAEAGIAQRLVAFALSPQGQTVIEQQGLISPLIKHAAPAAPPAPVIVTEIDRLRAFVAGAKKLGVVFHFEANSTALDPFGERELDRVLNYLVSIHDGGDHLLLAGFADNQGDAQTNVNVSRRRADTVAALFIRRGLKPGGVEGFGGALPVSDNTTEAGRDRNRRVEVYIKQ